MCEICSSSGEERKGGCAPSCKHGSLEGSHVVRDSRLSSSQQLLRPVPNPDANLLPSPSKPHLIRFTTAVIKAKFFFRQTPTVLFGKNPSGHSPGVRFRHSTPTNNLQKDSCNMLKVLVCLKDRFAGRRSNGLRTCNDQHVTV